MPLNPRSSATSDEHCPSRFSWLKPCWFFIHGSTRAMLPASPARHPTPSSPSSFPRRFSATSEEHRVSASFSSPAPIGPIGLSSLIPTPAPSSPMWPPNMSMVSIGAPSIMIPHLRCNLFKSSLTTWHHSCILNSPNVHPLSLPKSVLTTRAVAGTRRCSLASSFRTRFEVAPSITARSAGHTTPRAHRSSGKLSSAQSSTDGAPLATCMFQPRALACGQPFLLCRRPLRAGIPFTPCERKHEWHDTARQKREHRTRWHQK